MAAEIAIGLAGLLLSTLTIVLTVNASSRKNSERVAVIETKLNFVEEAVKDLKKSAGLTRRCTDCPTKRNEEE